jgi:hypothetical protein
MRNQKSGIRTIVLGLILIMMLGCVFLPSGQQTPTPTPTLSNSGGGGGANGGNGSGSGSGGGGGGNGGNGSGGTGNGSSSQSSNSDTTTAAQGPYVVKQIETLGHESIAGYVCSTTNAFIVNVAAPKAAFVFNFMPQAADHGTWTYAYSISSAGETHDASGNYKISPGEDNKLQLTMTGSDHVTFKGVDQKFPVNYKFDLVPSENTSCPNP